MKILFIYSLYEIMSFEKPLSTPEVIQFGISYISSFLKKHGHKTRLMVLSRVSGKKNLELIDRYLEEFSPDLICFSAVSSEYGFIRDIATYIRKKFPDIYLAIGGVHVSLNPDDEVLNTFDALCIGEGEWPVLELVNNLRDKKKPAGIQNLWIKSEKGIEKNSVRSFLRDLDQLPFPDRDMWKEWISETRGARESILLGRGCPFECTYCSNHALKKIAGGTYTRFRSPDNILSEIKSIVSETDKGKEIYLEVESISVNKEWVLELCGKIEEFNKERIRPISFGANVRITPKADLEDVFYAFKKSNFRFINIGLESGSERVRRDILKRNYSNEDVINAVKTARKYGFEVSFLNLVGIPGETIEDFKETIKINKICQPELTGLSIFYPYPGTELYSVCERKGFLKEPLNTEMERGRARLNLPGFSRKQIEKNYIWFDYNVYRGKKSLSVLLKRVLARQIRANPGLFVLYKKIKKSIYSSGNFLKKEKTRF
ncbi:MAG: radical SAM protein [Candidatus Omnitrophota bacterium]|nr:B12-binding domain-containing radical SAM protein [Candidatus Omnitrophota bacterium]